MNITIRTKYLVFASSRSAQRKRLCFAFRGKPVYELDVKLQNETPDFYAYIDVSRFLGMELSLTCEGAEPVFRESDGMDLPGLYCEEYRPQVHFTTRNGWINDPNGLVRLGGEYHMFYQHNPAGTEWGNMHWGHAVSRDLVKWQEKDIALFPDETGMMFSGCCFVDDRNRLGLQQGDDPTAILYYTATKPFAQYMAVSGDRFKTICKYRPEPVVPPIGSTESRDPKVIWCDELSCYLMALYVTADAYTLYRSDDLVHWEHFWDYRLEGEEELPDILIFTGADGTNRYVFTSNTDHYIVMRVQDGAFVPEGGMKALFHGSRNHAPVSFSNSPDGRCVRMIWIPFDGARYGMPFSGQLSTLDYSLDCVDGQYYLAAQPVRELETLYETSVLHQPVAVTEEGFCAPLADAAHLIRLKGSMPENTLVEISILGVPFEIDPAANEFRRADGSSRCPLCVTGHSLDITLLVDRCSFEVFADGGKSCMYGLIPKGMMDHKSPCIRLRTRTGRCTLDTLETHALRSIWESSAHH